MNQDQKRNTSLRFSNKSTKLLPRDISESLGKLPPQAIDLEEAVLGALMLERSTLGEVAEFLKPEHFYSEGHREIYNAIMQLFKSSEPVDMRTVVNQLRKDAKLELVGGAYYIGELTSKVSSSANIEYHARVIIEMSMKRDVIQIASEGHQIAYDDTTDIFDILERMQGGLDAIANQTIRGIPLPASVVFVKSLENMQAASQHKGITGVESGFTALDRMTSGWQNSDLVVIAARPGMGKTAFVVSAMRNAAIDFKKPVAIFSLEMASVQLMNRMISAECELDGEKIKKGQLADFEWQQLTHKTTRLSSAPIFIDDTPAITIIELRAKCRRLKSKHNIQLIIVDYLQLMRGDTGGNREQEIASISRALKGIAKELNVPVLALSQLSRGVETRGGDKRPMLSDLRESGSIEQDADIVMFIYRPEYYKITEYEDGMPTQGVGEVIIAKHRNGSTGSVQLKFIGKYTKFANFDQPAVPDGPISTFGAPMKKLDTPFSMDGVRDTSETEVQKPDDMPF